MGSKGLTSCTCGAKTSAYKVAAGISFERLWPEFDLLLISRCYTFANKVNDFMIQMESIVFTAGFLPCNPYDCMNQVMPLEFLIYKSPLAID